VVEETARTDTGRQRHANEDSHLARSPMFVVADGMGGAQAGEVASRIAAESFDGGVGEGSPEEELAGIAREANRRIFDLARSDPNRAGMGTTLTGALVSGDEVSIVHVGDSRAYLLRDGELRRLTRDHSLVEELRRRGQLTTEEAEEHPQRSVITRALGPEPEVELDVHTHQARAGDVFLLCSDGLTSMVREDRLREILVSSPTLGNAADRLVREANERGGRDNITVVCFRVEGAASAAAAAAEGPGAEDTSAEDTITGLHARDVQEAALAAEVETPPAPARTSAPAARPQGSRPPRRRALKAALALVLATAVIAGLVVGARAGTHQAYFVGEEGGLVTLYRGLPYDLPFGIELYQPRYVSSVPVRSLGTVERRRLLDHQIRSREDAADLIDRLERSQGS
jgi:protein phosphatase